MPLIHKGQGAPMRLLLSGSLCRVLGHRRSGRRIYIHPVERRWYSDCKLCGAPMRKEWPKGWQAVAEPPLGAN